MLIAILYLSLVNMNLFLKEIYIDLKCHQWKVDVICTVITHV